MVKSLLSFGNLFNSVVSTIRISSDVADGRHNDIDSAFKLFEKERRMGLSESLKKTMIGKIIPRCTKVLCLGSGASVELSAGTLEKVVKDMVDLGEQEPYGLKGGTLILNFGSVLNEKSEKGNDSQVLKLVKIGKFPLGEGIVSTFELHLTLYPSNHMKHKLANMVRKLKGKPTKIPISEKITITKKKLFRSPSHMN